ncbi:RNI-like protein [Auriscalpium vulgare]|uniref:RNI-like protein n=1 Tax=Auriscalpium vulgare TaxID=40419 RepID=A0ACB8RCW5_9AGAM|nr:RNI-like protein [Auriscalpium vulgare]
MRSNAAASGPKPPVGGFDTCARCSKQYTVTKYTIAAQPPPGYLCHTCAKAGGADPFKKPAAPRKRKAPANKRTVTNIEERRLPTLVSLCVQIISKHIEDVETLGDVGTANKDSIIRALSRSRSLTHENAGLFYNIENKSLTFYDATNLHPESLASLAMLNPNLTSLRLDFCGRMDDTVIDAWSSSLRSLTHLELLGPYLVRTPAWIAFFKANPQLEAFRIVQSPRFDLACMKALATSCKRLVDLRLKEVRLEDSFVGEIKKLKHLRALDLSDPPESLSEDGLVTLVKAIGKRLEVLDLSGHDMLTDDFFKKGLRANASSLMSLTLNNLTELSDSGVAAFLADVEMPSLTSVSLSRVPELGDEALSALLECAGKTLTALNMNTWRNTTQDGLKAIARSAPALKKLDLGWNREFDDFAMKEILDGCAQLEEIKCWGCNRLTESCPRKVCLVVSSCCLAAAIADTCVQRNVAVFGVESHLAA